VEQLEDRCLMSVNTATSVAGTSVDASNLSGYQGETAIAINPTNPQNIIAASNNLGSGSQNGFTEVYVSQNGGSTWTAINVGGNGDPGVAFDSNGVAYVSFINSSFGISVRTSTNGGVSWNAPVQVAPPPASGIQDKPTITTGVNALNPSQSIVYVGWDNNGLGDVAYVSSSTNAGVSWSTPTAIDGLANEFDTQLSVGPQGQLYATWQNFGTANTTSIMFSTSLNNGATWTTPTVAATSSINVFNPGYTIPAQNSRGISPTQGIVTEQSGANAGWIYMTYATAPAGQHNNTNIELIASNNGGATWTALGPTPIQVNNDTGTASQFFPAIAIDPTNGSVNLAWYDARNSGTANNAVDVYFQSYTSAGVPTGSNVKVTTQKSKETGRSANPNQFGDYMGIAAYGGLAYPVWTSHTSQTAGSEEILVDPPLTNSSSSTSAAAAPALPLMTSAVPVDQPSGAANLIGNATGSGAASPTAPATVLLGATPASPVSPGILPAVRPLDFAGLLRSASSSLGSANPAPITPPVVGFGSTRISGPDSSKDGDSSQPGTAPVTEQPSAEVRSTTSDGSSRTAAPDSLLNAGWRQALDNQFAEHAPLPGDPLNSDDVLLPALVGDVGATLDQAAMTVALAIGLVSCWGLPPVEEEPRRQQRHHKE
jgi:hypothetical protein